MNLYKFHSKPSQLSRYADALQVVPEVFVKDISGSPTFPSRPTERQLRSISKHHSAAAQYSVNVLKRRWPEAEPLLKKDTVFWDRYASAFL